MKRKIKLKLMCVMLVDTPHKVSRMCYIATIIHTELIRMERDRKTENEQQAKCDVDLC